MATVMAVVKHYAYHVPATAISNIAHAAGLTSRSTEWPRVRREWLKDHDFCAACGGKLCLQVHHKKPFHLHPELELNKLNFITLCECSPVNDHLHVGHKGDWKNFNANVEADAALMLKAKNHVGAQAG